jgi:two-component system OmpR family sensor kinase/two-component system phosphate regulon sensor histidine kinase PhoR
VFEQQQIKKERTDGFVRMLDNITVVIDNYLTCNNIPHENNVQEIAKLLRYMPPELRVTIIDLQGNVLFDNKIVDDNEMDNRLSRPEIQNAVANGYGTNIRFSDTKGVDYLYYAKLFDGKYLIRPALPYDLELRSFINATNSFAYYILLFFVICVLLMFYFLNRFSKAIRQLRDLSLSVKRGLPIPASFKFADNEVGEMSADIIENYTLLRENRAKLAMEREKLLQHFHYSEEGIAIFSKNRKQIYANSHFLQYLNAIIETPVIAAERIFSDAKFDDFVDFLNTNPRTENIFTKRIKSNNKIYNVRIIIFDDESFEFYISDITQAEKTRILKQEMTNNIAHELRTPVTSIRGYLETVLSRYDSDKNDAIYRFMDRAYAQTLRLSELIQDMSMLTKIEEASDLFELEPIQMKPLLEELHSDLSEKLNEKRNNFVIEVSENVVIYGSRTLLYSIFRNLTENAITYAGEQVTIVIRCYMENDSTYYFEFYDTGQGIEERHLVRIFERFYRINEGRTRNTGGSGLGLSIVKNAILFHKGSIIAKNRVEGGLSFLMTFPKGGTE